MIPPAKPSDAVCGDHVESISAAESQGGTTPPRVLLPLPVGHRLADEGLFLCVPDVAGLQFIRRMLADEETMRPVGGPVVHTADTAAAWYSRWVSPGSPDKACWLVMCEDRPVGEIGFRGYTVSRRAASLNVKIAAWERGHGYARQALRRLLQFYFGELSGEELTDDVALDNAAGQSLLVSEGFARDLEVTDACRLVLTRSRWASIGNRKVGNNTAQPRAAPDRKERGG